jgi:hypothetical protein
MKASIWAAACLLAMRAASDSANATPVIRSQAPVEFAGTMPCGEAPRAFLGGMEPGANCHAITWRLTLGPAANGPASWTLTATYGVPPASNPNLMIDGPKVALKGTWIKATRRDAPGMVYRLTSDARRTMSFVRISDELVHVLDDDDRLMVGTAGWSYTLNRADRMEQQGTPSLAPELSYTISPRGSGSAVFGVFEGRTPCVGIARELKITPVAGCLKVKWRVTLFQNAQTSQPTNYKIEGTLHRARAREGNWRILRGAGFEPSTIVYQLDATGTEAPLRLVVGGDDFVLFFQARDGRLLVGNADFSYTLNRVGP